MKARISDLGMLYIERVAGKFRAQCCPFIESPSLCGDWCPLFFEAGEAEHYVMLGCSARQDVEYIIDKDERNYDK